MEYGVVACPKCRRVQLVESRFQSVSCRACRSSFELSTRRFYYRGADEQTAREALLKASAQLQNMGIEDYSKLLKAMEQERKGTLDDLVAALGSVEFDQVQLAEHAARLRVPGTPEKILARLKSEDRVFEPRPGRFRVL